MIPLEKRVYLDEMGADQSPYAYGWSPCGERVRAKKSGLRGKRVSVIAGLLCGVLVAAHSFKGTCNKAVFMDWLSDHLLPHLSPGYTLIMDNAKFHKGSEIIRLIESKGCHVLYLPPYSPELNPIEKRWFPLKNNIRKHMRYMDMSLHAAVNHEISQFI